MAQSGTKWHNWHYQTIIYNVVFHVHDLDTMSNLLGKNEEDTRKGKALVAVSITEEQKSQIKQYDNDSSHVASSLEAMDAALDDLSSDVKELGRCLKQTTFATSQLQKVQAKIQSNIKNMLRGEKVKMELKEKNILSLDKKLRKIEKQQKKIIFGKKKRTYEPSDKWDFDQRKLTYKYL